MKLNIDCVRDVMVLLESKIGFKSVRDAGGTEQIHWGQVRFDEILRAKYGESDLIYSLQKLSEAHYIDVKATLNGTLWIDCYINDITWQGHEFLNAFRSDAIWEVAKEEAAEIEISSIKALWLIADKITKERIS